MAVELTFRDYQDGLEQGKLLGLYCECGTVTVPPQAVCCKCGSRKLEIGEIEKKGVIKTFTVIRIAAEGMTPPLIIAMVETNSGAWVMGNIIDMDPDSASMDLMGKKVVIESRPVKGDVYSYGDIHSIVFKLV